MEISEQIQAQHSSPSPLISVKVKPKHSYYTTKTWYYVHGEDRNIDKHSNNDTNNREHGIFAWKDEYNVSTQTGSLANCTTAALSTMKYESDSAFRSNYTDFIGRLFVSCHPIEYRIPYDSFSRLTTHTPSASIVVGVLSQSNTDGASRRRVIRSTWASIDHFHSIWDGHNQSSSTNRNNHTQGSTIITFPGVFFLVAGSWNDSLQQEFATFRDMIWIRESEVYNGEQSVLTYKTQAFLTIIHNHLKPYQNRYNYSYVFKTDDDCYVALDRLYSYLLLQDDDRRKKDTDKFRKDFTPSEPPTSDAMSSTNVKYSSATLPPLHVWGFCRPKQVEPSRNHNKDKWSISDQLYPEKYYPRYCQGAGYALSHDFVQCAVENGHIQNMRYMPFEDIFIGMLAERCNVTDFIHADQLIHLYRTGGTYGTLQERNYVNFLQTYSYDQFPSHRQLRNRNEKKKSLSQFIELPPANMNGKIIQHRIDSDEDMIEHHKNK